MSGINASWQFNVNGLYQGPWGLAFGANFFGRQGYPNPYFVRCRRTTSRAAALILIGKFDTYRYANVYELDFRLQKTFQIGPVKVIPTAELFNVTNANTVLNSDPSVGNYDGKSREFVQDPLQPDHRSAEPAHRAPGSAGEFLAFVGVAPEPPATARDCLRRGLRRPVQDDVEGRLLGGAFGNDGEEPLAVRRHVEGVPGLRPPWS